MTPTNLFFLLCFFQALSLIVAADKNTDSGTSTTHGITDTTHDVTDTTHGVTSTTRGKTSTTHGVKSTTHGITGTTHGVTGTTRSKTSTTHGATDTTHGATDTTHGATDTTHGATDTTHSVTSTTGGKTSTINGGTGTTDSETSTTDGGSDVTDKFSPSIFSQGAKTAATAAAEAIKKVTSIFGIDEEHGCIEPPFECPNENITFWYYSRPEVNSPVKISISNPESFKQVERNDRAWKVIIHGYTKSKDDIPNPQLLEAYRTQGRGHNIISVDYAPIARKLCYAQAVSNVPLISKCTAQMLDELINRGYMTLKNTHVIGFSLGGQISGRIHEYLSNGRPSRVTALDPASPLFDGKINEKVTQNAGDFVDVIHTNTMAFGLKEPSGHIDFYVNSGAVQPGCFDQKDNESLTTCSHNRSPIVYAESINSATGFWGVPCTSRLKFYSGKCDTVEENLVMMGEYTPVNSRGMYFVQTRDQPPYALGKLTKAFVEL